MYKFRIIEDADLYRNPKIYSVELCVLLYLFRLRFFAKLSSKKAEMASHKLTSHLTDAFENFTLTATHFGVLFLTVNVVVAKEMKH